MPDTRTVQAIDRDIRAKSRELQHAEDHGYYLHAALLAAEIDQLLDDRLLAVAELDDCTR